MNYLNELQCASLDKILQAFGGKSNIDGSQVLRVEPDIRKANGLINILKKRELITTIDAEEKDLPVIIFLDSSAAIFMDTGGFTGEYYRWQQEQARKTGSPVHIYSTGDGNVINTGSHNTIQATINLSKGNLDTLKNELSKHNVASDDIIEIVTIVEQEQPTGNALGPKSKSWMRKMLDKSMEGTWEVGLATAGGLLTEILKKYYGL